jgi:hypothetical protein
MNILTDIKKVISYVPYVAAGVIGAESVAQNEPGASKLQLAVDIANSLVPVADAAVPSAAPAIDASSALVKLVVNGIVSGMNLVGLFKHSSATPAPATK